MWRAEFIGAWAVLLFGLFIVVFSIPLQYYTELGPGPGFLPVLDRHRHHGRRRHRSR